MGFLFGLPFCFSLCLLLGLGGCAMLCFFPGYPGGLRFGFAMGFLFGLPFCFSLGFLSSFGGSADFRFLIGGSADCFRFGFPLCGKFRFPGGCLCFVHSLQALFFGLDLRLIHNHRLHYLRL